MDYVPGAGYPIGLAFKENLKNQPEVFTINEEKLTKQINYTIKCAQDLHAKNDATKEPGKEEIRKEHNALRQRLYDLQQNVRFWENTTNNTAGNIHNFEQRIIELLKKKKSCADNPLTERMYEHQIELLESEKLDAEQRLVKERNYHKNAVRELKAFDQYDRIKELAKQLFGE